MLPRPVRTSGPSPEPTSAAPRRAGRGPRPPDRPSRPAPRPTGRPLVLTVLTLLTLLLAAGTPGEASAQSPIPTDPSVLQERADRARVLGDTAAPIQIVEVSDFQCPFCARFWHETFPELERLYIETGKVEYIWISLTSAGHRYAWPAGEAAFCAGGAGLFWPMHDLLFENQEEWAGSENPSEHFVRYAGEIGLDREEFRDCILEDRPAPLLIRDLQSVSRAGIDGTPFFIIDNQVSIQGAVPLANFRSVLDSALNATPGASPPTN